MLKICENCGREFVARRSTAKYCSNICRVRAQRLVVRRPRYYEVPEVTFSMTVDEAAQVVQSAHRVTDDLGRASEHTPEPISGKLRRCAQGFADALGREGL